MFMSMDRKTHLKLVICILLHIFVNHAYSINALRKKEIQNFTDKKLNSGNIYK